MDIMMNSRHGVSIRTRHRLVMRDSINPSFGFAMLFMTVFASIWAYGAYITSRDMEPMIISCITHLCVIDSNSYRVHLVLAIIFIIITSCCFRIVKSEIKT